MCSGRIWQHSQSEAGYLAPEITNWMEFPLLQSSTAREADSCECLCLCGRPILAVSGIGAANHESSELCCLLRYAPANRPFNG
jgi:hypothetical protein